MQYWQARYAIKAGGSEVVVIPYPDGVGIGIVCMKYRVFIGSISIIRHPYLGYIFLLSKKYIA
jgi:hypothetical protein